jgi:hypothetical protein
MSYDLQIWSVHPVDEAGFHKPELWEKKDRAWTHAQKRWQLIVSHSDRLLPEDIPEEVAALLPGIEYLTSLNLEGDAPERARKLAQSTATGLARAAHGVIADPQEDSFRLPTGIKRFASPKNEDVFDVVALSWWFLESSLPTREGFSAFVGLLESLLPEALPKRYGDYEPPQNIYAETGKERFLNFVEGASYHVSVWYPHRPVAGVYLSTPRPIGAYHMGFRAGYLQIEVEKSALVQPGWSTNLRRFWKKTSALISPIYGDVRVLSGYRRHGASVGIMPGYAEHPVQSWWWTGIPKNLGVAVVLGPRYQALWPAFVSTAELLDGLAFASTDDWTLESDLAGFVGHPPADQIQVSPKFASRDQKYPTGWPFGSQFLPRETPKFPTPRERNKANKSASPPSFKDKLMSLLRRPPHGRS